VVLVIVILFRNRCNKQTKQVGIIKIA
jgi:hypothetical protein